jgi:endogenous inhibitor of DNA gyrase (YacG/DUF329 family)
MTTMRTRKCAAYGFPFRSALPAAEEPYCSVICARIAAQAWIFAGLRDFASQHAISERMPARWPR